MSREDLLELLIVGFGLAALENDEPVQLALEAARKFAHILPGPAERSKTAVGKSLPNCGL